MSTPKYFEHFGMLEEALPKRILHLESVDHTVKLFYIACLKCTKHAYILIVNNLCKAKISFNVFNLHFSSLKGCWLYLLCCTQGHNVQSYVSSDILLVPRNLVNFPYLGNDLKPESWPPFPTKTACQDTSGDVYLLKSISSYLIKVKLYFWLII